MTQNKGSACRRICLLCQQTSPKRWFGNTNMTSNCDVTNSAHQMQMTTICHWMKPPIKIFCVRHWLSPYLFAVYLYDLSTCLLTIFVCFVQMYEGCKVNLMCVRLMQIAWNYFQLQQNLCTTFTAKSAKSTVIPLLTLDANCCLKFLAWKNWIVFCTATVG